MANPLLEVQKYGQSIWLDYIRRSLISSGGLQALIQNDGLRGVTSNPSIFEKAIGGSTDYDDALKALVQKSDVDAKTLFEALAIQDIQQAADLFRPVYEQTRKRDGYVSMEVSPYLAHDTQGTIEEARRLWKALARPNVFIKVPATPEGIPAIRQLISEGINVNVTLLFSRQVYETVANAFIEGLEALVARGGDPSGVASVASFFVSRIDTAVDAQLTGHLQQSNDPREQDLLKSLEGQAAIANAKLTYPRYKELFGSPRWQTLAQKGAQTQRLLWASTSTKNPAYRDVRYVEELIGPDTVDTVPSATLDAFRDHGRPRPSLQEGVEDARRTMEALAQVGISMDEVTARLVEDGVRLFADAFDNLLGAVERKRAAILGSRLDRQSFALPQELDQAVKASLEEWRVSGKIRRLWARDPSVWTGDAENQWLGWLDIACDQMAHAEPFQRLAQEVKQAGFTHAMVLGMGGSSLFPEVQAMTFGTIAGFPELLVLDSTDPARIRSLEGRIDLARTLFIVSSKSGTTLEPNIFHQYFFERVKQAVGEQEAGKRFIAITDPGSKLLQVAEAQRFRRVYSGVPSIGGRYSALSNFGMVPAAAMGLDVAGFLDRAEEMVHSCAGVVPPEENPGVVLGTILGVLANHGRDKVTIVTSPGIGDFGAWLEQLLAESTGKQGKGLIPVDREPLGPPEVYGQDRLFVYTRLEKAPDPAQDRAVDALQAAGQPVVRIALADPFELGEEVFRWEIATAVAGSVIGINPFDQPDVEASKIATRKLTSQYEQTGSPPPETSFFEGDGIRLFADTTNAAALQSAAGNDRSLTGLLKAHLGRLRAGDYFALLAYIEMNDANEAALQGMRQRVRDTRRVATCGGFGPRYLHSTGQAYKGGPNTGVFLQITADDAADLPVPGQKYTFGVVKAAQARGDFEVLTERGRRALRAHLGPDVAAGLAALQSAMEQTLGGRMG
jgi:transaldolase/glucose-6-phosphate isomerase